MSVNIKFVESLSDNSTHIRYAPRIDGGHPGCFTFTVDPTDREGWRHGTVAFERTPPYAGGEGGSRLIVSAHGADVVNPRGKTWTLRDTDPDNEHHAIKAAVEYLAALPAVDMDEMRRIEDEEWDEYQRALDRQQHAIWDD